VRYIVAEKTFKAIPPGTLLDFHLFSDAACTQTVFSQSNAIEFIDVVSRLRLLTPSGVTPAPKTDELMNTLVGVPSTLHPSPPASR
jgi:hypothetical protein